MTGTPDQPVNPQPAAETDGVDVWQHFADPDATPGQPDTQKIETAAQDPTKQVVMPIDVPLDERRYARPVGPEKRFGWKTLSGVALLAVLTGAVAAVALKRNTESSGNAIPAATTDGSPVSATTTSLSEAVTTTVPPSFAESTTSFVPPTSEAPTGTTIPDSWEYGIQKGDTMRSIAAKYKIPYDLLVANNSQIKNPDQIVEGKILAMPPSSAFSTTTTGPETSVANSQEPTASVEPQPTDTTPIATETTAAAPEIPLDDSPLTLEQCTTLGGVLFRFPPDANTQSPPITLYSKLKEAGIKEGTELNALLASTMQSDFHVVNVTIDRDECIITVQTARDRYLSQVQVPTTQAA